MSKHKTKKSASKKSNGGNRALDVLLSLALAAGVGFGGYQLATSFQPIDQTTTYSGNQEGDPNAELPDGDKTIYQNEEHHNSEIHSGYLMLVNNDVPFLGTEDDIVSVYEEILKNDYTEILSVRDAEVMVRQLFCDQMLKMLKDFNTETGDTDILLLSGYRSQELQQEMYDEDLAETGLDYSELVAKPGYSEHQTGWCIDLDLTSGDYDGTGIYKWIEEHCYEYGFVMRYRENKTQITGIRFEPWHYRYVGQPHAYYMEHNDLCLEEYMEILHQYPYDGEHLIINNYDGKQYEVYYVEKEEGFESTMVPVPDSQPYEVLGDNMNGFIVTAETGVTGEFPQDAEPDVPEEETAAETEGESSEE